MILTFDIGNSETTVGLFDGDTLRNHWRLTTTPHRTSDETAVVLRALVQSVGVVPSDVAGIAICSVVPTATQPLVDGCDVAFARTPVIIDGRSKLPIVLDVDDPGTVGPDLVVNALAAKVLHARDCIVVDMGTATTYQCITASGVFFGAVIQPGVRTAAASLFQKTAMLPSTALVAPERAMGRNTVECIRSGVVFGAADSIDGLIRRLKAEWPRPHAPYVIATGGLASAFRTFCTEFDHVDPALTLQGLRVGYGILAG